MNLKLKLLRGRLTTATLRLKLSHVIRQLLISILVSIVINHQGFFFRIYVSDIMVKSKYYSMHFTTQETFLPGIRTRTARRNTNIYLPPSCLSYTTSLYRSASRGTTSSTVKLRISANFAVILIRPVTKWWGRQTAVHGWTPTVRSCLQVNGHRHSKFEVKYLSTLDKEFNFVKGKGFNSC